jgi:predicted GH43/DUF377 family glycosyl hydrolase
VHVVNQYRPSLPILKDLGVEVIDITEKSPDYAFNPSISIVNDQLLLSVKVFASCNAKTYITKLNSNLFPTEWDLVNFETDTLDCPPEDIRIITRNKEIFLIGARPALNYKDYHKHIPFSTCVYKLNLENFKASPFLFFKELGNFSNKNWVTLSSDEKLSFNFIVSHPDSVRGGSNLVPYEDGYISVGHKTYIPDLNHILDRYYSNVLIKYDKLFDIEKISKEFLFEGYNVEFATGLVQQKDNFIISYGVNDSGCHLATLTKENINSLWKEK